MEWAIHIQINKVTDKPIRSIKEYTVFELLPLSRIMKNRAEPKLASMQIKAIKIIHFIGRNRNTQ